MTDFSNLLARENRLGEVVNVSTIQRRISYFVATPPTKLIGCLKFNSQIIQCHISQLFYSRINYIIYRYIYNI